MSTCSLSTENRFKGKKLHRNAVFERMKTPNASGNIDWLPGEIVMEKEHMHYTDVLKRILWALDMGCGTILYIRESTVPGEFSLEWLTRKELATLRKAILESDTKVIALPGAICLPCLLGNGEDAYQVKPGMRFIPPGWFQTKPDWEKLAANGIKYLVDYEIAHPR